MSRQFFWSGCDWLPPYNFPTLLPSGNPNHPIFPRNHDARLRSWDSAFCQKGKIFEDFKMYMQLQREEQTVYWLSREIMMVFQAFVDWFSLMADASRPSGC